MHLGEKGQTQATSVQGHQLRGGHRSKERACSHLSTFNYIPRQTAKTEILNTISFCPWNLILVGWWGWEMKGCRILLHGIFSLSGSINYLRYPGTNLYLLGWRHLSLTELQWLFSPRYILWISNNANGPKCCYKLKQLNGFSAEEHRFPWTLALLNASTSRITVTWYASRSVSTERTIHSSERRGLEGGEGRRGEAKTL